MRLISFSLTTEQFRNRTKICTRRLGWTHLKAGDLLMGCEKVMGRQGAPLVRLGVIVVTDVRREPLGLMKSNSLYGHRECKSEGFPHMTGGRFVQMFCDHMGCNPGTEVTRIEFRYVPGGRLS